MIGGRSVEIVSFHHLFFLSIRGLHRNPFMKPDQMATNNTLKNEVSGESERISTKKHFKEGIQEATIVNRFSSSHLIIET